MNRITRQRLANGKRRIAHRLREIHWPSQERPMLAASNIHYELARRSRGLACGGIGAMHLLARQTGLAEAIDRRLHLLKVHKPYHESDHVLNVAYNILAGGTCMEDIELRRNDEVYLDALGTQRIPDPTTEGDFCRRFSAADVETLMGAINEVRLGVWKRQPAAFFERAVIDADGTLASTLGQCKEGMDISYKGQWGYHPLLISLANTGEPLYLVNRSGNRPSSEGAAARLDQAIALCRRAGFRSILLRGDTDFTQTSKLDEWDAAGDVEFLFGIDAMPNLVKIADALPRTAWKRLVRPAKYEVATQERARPENVKERIVKERAFENIRLFSEIVAQFEYRPTACRKSYRVVVVCKNLTVEKGENLLFDDVRYFFYITNDCTAPAEQIVLSANGRCNQENLIEQLKNGARAMEMPVGDLVSNWAYMVMASLAWTLKAWLALVLPESGRWHQKHRSQKQSLLRMEFKTFLNGLMRLPCQIVRTSRRIVYRLLSWNPWQEVLLRAVDALRLPMRC
ncbi:MAG: IS1380 family transposase [Phycisphaerae bacterium]|nr:IS1380 family transposase [Phycisphaerae bacterium]